MLFACKSRRLLWARQTRYCRNAQIDSPKQVKHRIVIITIADQYASEEGSAKEAAVYGRVPEGVPGNLPTGVSEGSGELELGKEVVRKLRDRSGDAVSSGE